MGGRDQTFQGGKWSGWFAQSPEKVLAYSRGSRDKEPLSSISISFSIIVVSVNYY